MPAKINKEIINNINSLEVLDQKIKELETSLTSLKEDQNDLKSKIKPYKDNSVSCITKDGTRGLIGDWDIGDDRKILADEIRARDSAGLKLYDDGGNGIFIKDGGNMGIGTINPLANLHIDTTTPTIRLTPDPGEYGRIQFTDATPSYVLGEIYVNAGDEKMYLYSYRLIIQRNGNIGINTSVPTTKLDINSDIFRLRTAKTPASAGASGNQGDFCWDANFIYICTATNTWKRVAIATW